MKNNYDRSQIVLTSDNFFFQTGNDPTVSVGCKLIDVFHKRIYARVSNNRKARVVSFIFETTNFIDISMNNPNIYVKTWVLYLSQPNVGDNYIGGNMELQRWYSQNDGGLFIEDDFQTTYDPSSSFNADTGYSALNPYDMLKVGTTMYAPISLLRNQKVTGLRKIGDNTVNSRLITLYRPIVYKVSPDFRNYAGFSLPFFALGYESYQPYDNGLSKQLSIITNPYINEFF